MGPALVGFGVVLLAAAGCGMRLLRALRADRDSPAEQFVLGAAAGLGILAYAILAVGLLGFLRLSVLLGLVAVEAALGARALVAWARSIVERREPGGRPEPVTRLLLLYCLLIV